MAQRKTGSRGKGPLSSGKISRAKTTVPDSADESALKREVAGRYRTRDERFTVEESSGRWLLIDAAETDDLGQPLIRGPFATLDGARGAIAAARAEPAPASDLARRLAARPKAQPATRTTEAGPARERAPDRGGPRAGAGRTKSAAGSRKRQPETEPVHIREYRRSDGDALRDLWREAGFRLRGDDDDSLAAMARRNPGLLLVAVEDKEIVGSALGAWDGRHGWIYHMAAARSRRRSGIGTALVQEVERRLAAVGCHDVNVNVGEGNDTAQRFWKAVGYPPVETRRFRKELRRD